MDNSKYWSPAEKSREQLLRELSAAAASPVWRNLNSLIAERPPPLRSIELGSGLGKLSILMALLGHQVTFLDSNAEALAQARKFLDGAGIACRTLQADLLEFPGELQGQFDVSLSVGTLEHFAGHEDRWRAFHAHAAVLKPGGVALIAVPNRLGLFYRPVFGLRRALGFWPRQMPEIPYSARELKSLGRQAGFAQLQVRGLAPLSEDFRDWVLPNIGSLSRKLTGYPSKQAGRAGIDSLREIAQKAREAGGPAQPLMGYPLSAGLVMTGSKVP